MADNTRIEWADATWNPVTGCSHVSPGCEHCFAERLSTRFGWTTQPWGAQHAAENVRMHPERLGQPLRWRTPRRIFVCSMADLFHPLVPDEFLLSCIGAMALAERHTFLVLTKRPRRMWEFFRSYPEPPSNVWLGISCEDQRRADERIPLLLETPTAVRFLSCEPLLDPVDLRPWLPQIDWVIVGGESGPQARPMDLDWARQIRDQCQAAGVPFFFKQVGGLRPGGPALLDGREWREFPERPGVEAMA